MDGLLRAFFISYIYIPCFAVLCSAMLCCAVLCCDMLCYASGVLPRLLKRGYICIGFSLRVPLYTLQYLYILLHTHRISPSVLARSSA